MPVASTPRIAMLGILAAAGRAAAAGPAAAQISVRNTTLGKAAILSDDAPPGPEKARMGINIVDVDLGFPLLIRGDMEDDDAKGAFLGGGLGLRRQDFLYDWPDGDTEYKPERVYGLSLGFVFVRKHGPHWTTVAFAGSGIFSDLKNVDGNDFLYNGGTFLVRNVGESWRVGGGIVATYAFGDPVVIPIPYVDYVGRGRLLIDFEMPEYLLVGCRFSPRLEAGVATRLVFDNYKLGDERARDADGEKASIVFSDVTVGLETRVRLAGPLRFDVALARTVHRKLEIADHRGDTLYERGLDPAWVLTAGLAVVGLGPVD